MTIITESKAKASLDELLDEVTDGQGFVITRHRKPVARLIPERNQRLERIRRTGEVLQALQNEIAIFYSGKPSASWEEFKCMMAEDHL